MNSETEFVINFKPIFQDHHQSVLVVLSVLHHGNQAQLIHGCEENARLKLDNINNVIIIKILFFIN